MGEHRNAMPGFPAQPRTKKRGDGYKARQRIRARSRLLYDGRTISNQATAAAPKRESIGKRIADSMKRALSLGLGKLARRSAP